MNDLELYVYDINLNLLGIIDVFENAQIKGMHYNHSMLNLVVNANETIAKLLLVNHDELEKELRILVRSDDLTRGFILETAQFDEETKTTINVIGYSLSIMTRWRIIKGQQVFRGNIEDVMKSFVNANCIATTPERVIPRLTLADNEGIDITADETFRDIHLDVALWEMCKKYEVSFEILIDLPSKNFRFRTFQGVDRTSKQSENARVIFSQEFENVTRQAYTDDKYSYFNSVYITGEGEAPNAVQTEIGSSNFGYNRRELFYDASQIKSEMDDNGTTITIPQDEYILLLKGSANNYLQNFQRIRAFDSVINPNSQFIFKKDYFLGDIVTNENSDLSILINNRIVVVNETFNRSGYSLSLEFGTGIPTFIDKLKREVK